MPQCPTCGANAPEQAVVCSDCGMDLTGIDAAPKAEASPVNPLPELGASSPSLSGFPSYPSPPTAGDLKGLARLTLRRNGILTNEVFELGERVTIGRFEPDLGPVDVDLGFLPESIYISRHHAQIWRDGANQWFVKDLGSRNGTFVRPTGESQLQAAHGEQAIKDGDEVALGNVHFQFQVL